MHATSDARVWPILSGPMDVLVMSSRIPFGFEGILVDDMLSSLSVEMLFA